MKLFFSGIKVRVWKNLQNQDCEIDFIDGYHVSKTIKANITEVLEAVTEHFDKVQKDLIETAVKFSNKSITTSFGQSDLTELRALLLKQV